MRPFYALLLLALCVGTQATSAQDVSWRHATLAAWAGDVRTAVRDRRHAEGGLFFDRGLFRRFTDRMDHEYDLDVFTFGFTPAEDFAWWHYSEGGFRSAFGSYVKSAFAAQHLLRQHATLRGRHTARLEARLQEDLTADRLFMSIGYDARLGRKHHVGFEQTIAAYKPDLDFTLFYEQSVSPHGLLRAEVAVLDVVNNFIFDRLGVSSAVLDTVRVYRRRPYLLAASGRSPTWQGWRGELYAGLQPHTTADVAQQTNPEVRFRLDEWVHYAGALVEHDFGRWAPVTAGALLRRTFSRLHRTAPPASRFTSDFVSRQVDVRATLYLLADAGPLRAEVYLTRERYTDTQSGISFDQSSIPSPLGYRERRWLSRLRLHRVPPHAGFRGGLDLLLSRRAFRDLETLEASFLRFAQHDADDRLTLFAGYQFRPRAYLVIGFTYDFDGDTDVRTSPPAKYDGGYCRIALRW